MLSIYFKVLNPYERILVYVYIIMLMLFVLLLYVFHIILIFYLFIFFTLSISINHAQYIQILNMHHLLHVLIILILLYQDVIFFLMLLLHSIVNIHPMFHISFSIFLSPPSILSRYSVLSTHFQMNPILIFLSSDIFTSLLSYIHTNYLQALFLIFSNYYNHIYLLKLFRPLFTKVVIC